MLGWFLFSFHDKLDLNLCAAFAKSYTMNTLKALKGPLLAINNMPTAFGFQ
jgi:hypothetical protein